MSSFTDAAIEERFEVGDGADLYVSNVSGSISVRAVEGSEIRMRAVKHGHGHAQENTRIETAQEGNRVSIQTRTEDNGWLKIGRNMCSVSYEITVPTGCRVHTKAVSADIAVRGTQAPVQIDSVSGDVVIEDAGESCTVTTVSGDFEGTRLQGNLSLRTTSGDTVVHDSRLETFNCHTVSGDVTIESPLTPDAHYYAKTVSGDLVIRVPTGTGATVQMKSVSGDVISELPAQIVKAGRRHWQGRINGGEAQLELHSVSGDLRIVAAPGLPAAAGYSSESEPAVTDLAPQLRSEAGVSAVLQALEQGSVSVEEAMAQLRALR